MNAERLLKNFYRISEAPDAIPRLRRVHPLHHRRGARDIGCACVC